MALSRLALGTSSLEGMRLLTAQKAHLPSLKRLHLAIGVREVAEVLLVVLAFFLYFGVRGLVVERVQEAERHAANLIALERQLGIYWEPHLQDLILKDDWIRRVANGVYLYGHGPVIAITAVLLYVRDRKTYLLTRNTFLLSGAIGLMIYYLYPVAPPRLVPDSGFIDTVLEEYHVRRVLMPAFLTNEYAAVPSLHFGWNLAIASAIWISFPNLLARGFAFVMPVMMLIAIIITGNHFILDALAGTVVTAIGALLAFGLKRVVEANLNDGGLVQGALRWLLGSDRKAREVSQSRVPRATGI